MSDGFDLGEDILDCTFYKDPFNLCWRTDEVRSRGLRELKAEGNEQVIGGLGERK